MAMRQAERGATPATNFFVGRFSENFGQQNRIGGMVSLRNDPHGTNIESTIDGFFRLGESQSLNTILTHTVSTRTNKQGFAGLAQYYNNTLHYKFWLTQSVVTKDFSPEMGFISRTDVIGTSTGINWYYRGKFCLQKILRAFEPGILPEFYLQASSGKLIEAPFLFGPSGSIFKVALTWVTPLSLLPAAI
jgi:hypothetical protein